jgi:transposase InsO family protein
LATAINSTAINACDGPGTIPAARDNCTRNVVQLPLALASPSGPSLSEQERSDAERRFRVIEPLTNRDKFRLLWAECGSRAGKVVDFLSKQHGIPRRTLYFWQQRFDAEGLPGLVKKGRSDKGTPRKLTAPALDFILAAALPRPGVYGALSVREIFRAYQEERAWRAAHANKCLTGEFEEKKYGRLLDKTGRLSAKAQLPAASYETFRVWYGRIPEVARVLARSGAEAFSNTQECISFRNFADIQPMDYVVMDHRRLDFFCLVRAKSGWALIRPWLTAAIDMRTRKWLAWVMVETPSSDSIAAVLKRVFISHGLPAALYWDNGKDFTCEWLEGSALRTRQGAAVGELGTAWRGVLDSLGVRVHHAIVRRARSKIIEPNFGNTANFDKTLPWYCGHRPTARPERFADLLARHERWLKGELAEPAFPTIEDAAALYDEQLTALNEREHSGEGMRKITPTGVGWMCPNEAWERLIPHVERRTVAAEVLQFAFAKRRDITVRNGEVRTTFGGQQFHYRMIQSSVALMAFNGRAVQLAYDPLDLGTAAVYCENRFLGLANNVELRRMGEDTFVQDERDRRAARREVKRFITAVHQHVHVAGPAERMARRAAVRPAAAEPARPEVAVPLPAPIVEASEAAAQDRGFSFAASGGAAVIRAENRAAYQDDDGDVFRFFQEESADGSPVAG